MADLLSYMRDLAARMRPVQSPPQIVAGGTYLLVAADVTRWAFGVVAGNIGGQASISMDGNSTSGVIACPQNELLWFDMHKYGTLVQQDWYIYWTAPGGQHVVYTLQLTQ